MAAPAAPLMPLTEEQRAEAAKHIGLAYLVASRSHVPLDGDERISVALEAICRGVARFDPDRKIKISTYLSATVNHGLRRAWIDQKLVRVPCYLYGSGPRRRDCAERAEAAASIRSLESAALGTWQPEAPDPDAADRDCEERAEWLRAAIARLPGRMRELVELRLAGMTLRDVGEALGVGYVRALRLERRAYAMLRAILSE